MSIGPLTYDKATVRELNTFENRWKTYTRNQRVIYLRSQGVTLKGTETGDKLIQIAIAHEPSIEAPPLAEMRDTIAEYRKNKNKTAVEHVPDDETELENMKRPQLLKMASEQNIEGAFKMKNDALKEALSA